MNSLLNSELSNRISKIQKINKARNKKSINNQEIVKNLEYDSNEYTTVSSFSKKSKGNDSINDLKAKNKEILKNLSIELSPKNINEVKNKKKNIKSSNNNNINIINCLGEKNSNLKRDKNLSPKINIGKPKINNNEKKKVNSAYNSPIHYTLQPKESLKEENLELSPKIDTLVVNIENKPKTNKLIPNIMKKLKEYENEIEESKNENEKLKQVNEEYKEKIKYLKEEIKHIKERSRNNDKIREHERTIKNLNSFLEKQTKDFEIEKMKLLKELNEQININQKLSKQLMNIEKKKFEDSQDIRIQLKNQEKQLQIKNEQINKLREQIYLMTNQGGNNTIPSDPNESFDN